MNFVHGYPYVSVSLGFAYKSRPTVGVVYNPFYHHLYSACRSKGAYLQDFRGRHSLPLRHPAPPLGGLKDSLIAVEWGKEREGINWETTTETFKKLGAKKGGMVHDLRTFGGAALNLCAVASGTVDGEITGDQYLCESQLRRLAEQFAGAEAGMHGFVPRLGRVYCGSASNPLLQRTSVRVGPFC
jgi:fructose-1,6-bisphosphatase/inositol monophosphatase family enzyme